LMLYGVAVAGMFFVWGVILLTHISFRRALGRERVEELPIRIHLYPYSTWLGLIAIAAIALTTFFVDGLQYTVPAFLPFLLLVSIAYWRVRGKESRVTATAL
jgi:AAT family amino acid transporter